MLLLLFLLFILEELEESSVLLLSVVEYEPLLNPCEAPSLLEDALESELLSDLVSLSFFEDVLELALEPLLPLEKSPDLNPSALLELVESEVLLDDELLEDLFDDPLTEPVLNPLFEIELPLDLLLLELDLLEVDLAKATVLLDGVIPVNDKISKGRLENANIKVKSIVKRYFFLIL